MAENNTKDESRVPEMGTGMDTAPETGKDAASNAASAGSKVTKKALTTRGVFLIGLGGLLLVLLIIGAVAWYTRISVVNQMTMDAAQYDFKANYSSNDFIIYAKDYIDVYGEHKAAPGTGGVIPILVQAGDSNVDSKYILTLNTKDVDPEFKRRIRYFYIPHDKLALAYHDGVYDPQYEVEFNSKNTINGTLKGTPDTNGGNNITGEEHYEYIYWEWVYDLNPYRFYSDKTGVDGKWLIAYDDSNKATFSEIFGVEKDGEKDTSEAIKKFDEFDTAIGLGKYDEKYKNYATRSQIIYKTNPDGSYTEEIGTLKAYQAAMESKIDIVGAMAKPTYDKDPDNGNPPQNLGSGTYGTCYVPLGAVINKHNEVYQEWTPEPDPEPEPEPDPDLDPTPDPTPDP